MKTKTAKEFWREKFAEYPQSDAEKLAVVMMQEYAFYLDLANKLPFLRWSNKKPTITKECLLITATLSGEKWSYELFKILKLVDYDGKWVLGSFTAKGDKQNICYEDLSADLYYIMKLLK